MNIDTYHPRSTKKVEMKKAFAWLIKIQRSPFYRGTSGGKGFPEHTLMDSLALTSNLSVASFVVQHGIITLILVLSQCYYLI